MKKKKKEAYESISERQQKEPLSQECSAQWSSYLGRGGTKLFQQIEMIETLIFSYTY